MNPVRIILAVIFVNTGGIILRYYNLPAYFIFLGFRFHIACLVPFIFLLSKENLRTLAEAFGKPYFKKKFIPFLWIICAIIILLGILFLLKSIKYNEPEYFYEFGLSSVFDYPLYLIWNFPQLCFLFLTLLIVSRINRLSYLNVFLGLILLFGFELIPLNTKFVPVDAASMVLLFLIASFFVTNLQNIYWFSVIVFSSLWSIILLFGSKSETLINLLFAREYSSWDGFFEIGKQFSPYIVPFFFLLLLIIVAFYSFFHREKA